MAASNGEVKNDRVSEDGKNAKQLVCKRCNCKILPPNMGTFVTQEPFELHIMHKKGEEESDTQMIKEFFKVNDMFDFDNVGFSNTVRNIKYLACADCDVGPIGYHTIDDRASFVALDRVDHV